MIKNHLFLIIFILGFLGFSFLTYKSYPINSDEEFRYLRGKETLEHLRFGNFTEKLIQPVPNYFLYNFYTMGLVALNPNFYYEWFHLFSLIFSTLGFIAIYFLGYKLLNNKYWAMVPLMSLILFPIFFGQLALNPIDMPFMVFHTLLLLALLKYSKENSTHYSTLLLGLLFGVTQGLRQLGFTLYILMVLLDVYDYFLSAKSLRPKLKTFIFARILKYTYIFIIANFFMLITWPNFAVNFFKSYVWFLFIGANFYLWDYGLLFFGKFLQNSERPWYYLPFFQLTTYPLYLFVLSLPTVVFFKSQLKNRPYFLLCMTLVVNYALYLLLSPVLYDGIRHFLYLVPVVVLLGIFNLKMILLKVANKYLKYLILLGIAINVGVLAIHTYRAFPYHYVYFNEIGFLFGNPYKLFESDYESALYKKGAEWIRDDYLKDESVYSHSNPKLMLKVFACDNGFSVDYFSHKKFLTVIHKVQADLILCDYRNLKQSGYSGTLIKSFTLQDQEELFILSPTTGPGVVPFF